MDKFKGKLPKDDLKRFAKEISKKLVNSDFKNERVGDPTKITSRKEKQVKMYVKEYFDKAAAKHKERELRKAERKAKQAIPPESSAIAGAAEKKNEEHESDADQDMAILDDEDEKLKVESTTPITPRDYVLAADGLKRKREDVEGVKSEDPDSTPSKMLKSETPPPPPPPPPPPAPANGSYPSPITGSYGDVDEAEVRSNGTHSIGGSPMETQTIGANVPPPPPNPPGPSTTNSDS